MAAFQVTTEAIIGSDAYDHCPRLFYRAARNRTFRARLIS
jgi:hypothetical protein